MTVAEPIEERLTAAQERLETSRRETRTDIDIEAVLRDIEFGLDAAVESAYQASRIRMMAATTLRNLATDTSHAQQLAEEHDRVIDIIEALQQQLLQTTRADASTGARERLVATQTAVLGSIRYAIGHSTGKEWQELLDMQPLFVHERSPPRLGQLFLINIEYLIGVENGSTLAPDNLEPALTHPRSKVVEQAISLLGKMAEQDSTAVEPYLETVRSLLTEGPPEIATAAAELCVTLVETASLRGYLDDALVAGLNRDEFAVQAACARAMIGHPELSASRLPAVKQAIIENLSHPEPDIRATAARTLSECPAMYDPAELSLEPLIEYFTDDYTEFVRAAAGVFHQIAKAAPERLKPYLDTILEPPVEDRRTSMLLGSRIALQLSENRPRLLAPHVDQFRTLLLDETETEFDTDSRFRRTVAQFQQAAGIGPRRLMGLDSFTASRSFEMSYRRLARRRGRSTDVDSLQLIRSGFVIVLGRIAGAADAGPARTATHALVDGLQSEKDLIAARSAVMLCASQPIDDALRLEYLPLLLRTAETALTNDNHDRARVIMMIALQGTRPATSVPFDPFPDGVVADTLSVAAQVVSDPSVDPVDASLVAGLIQGVIPGMLPSGTERETPLEFIPDHRREVRHDEDIAAIRERLTSQLRGHQSTLEQLASTELGKPLKSLFALLSVQRSTGDLRIPLVSVVVEGVAGIADDRVEFVEEDKFRKTLTDAMNSVAEESASDLQLDPIVGMLFEEPDATLDLGASHLTAVAAETPHAIIPYHDQLLRLARETASDTTDAFHAALAHIAVTLPAHTTMDRELFVDALFGGDQRMEIGAVGLAGLAREAPMALESALPSLATSLENAPSIVAQQHLCYAIRRVLTSSTNDHHRIEPAIDRARDSVAPGVYTARDEAIDTWLTERTTDDKGLLEEQFQAITWELEGNQS